MNQIDIELYKTFSKKELVEGCMIYCPTYEGEKYIIINKHNIEDATRSEYGIFIKTTYGRVTYKYEILGTEPRLEDVFQKAKEKKIAIEISYEPMYPSSEGVWILDSTGKCKIDYNPCLSLLNQTDETKQELLNLFK